MEIIETPVFTKKIVTFLSDREYSEVQWVLIKNPEADPVIPEGGGLRKLRCSVGRKGKSGGLRIIYYIYARDEKIYMIFPYKKTKQEDLTKKQLKILRLYVKEGVL